MKVKHLNPLMMKKIVLIPLALAGLFFGTSAQAQLLPPSPDTVGYIEFDFLGGATAIDRDLAGGILLFPVDGDIGDIEPLNPYTWCFEVSLGYEYEYSYFGQDQIEFDAIVPLIEPITGSGSLDEAFELGQATPADVFEYLFTGPPPPSPATGTDIISFYNGIPGFTDVGWPAPLGIGGGDAYFEFIADDFPLIEIYFGSESVDPSLIGELYFEGQARLSVKEINTTAIPEPSTYGMIGAAFLVTLVVFRRRSMAKKA